MIWREIWSQLGLKLWTPERIARHITSLIVIVIILVAAYLVYRLISSLLHKLVKRERGLLLNGKRRTIIPLIRNVLMYVIGFVALIMVLHQLGINYTAILAGAGVVGLAIGFGAQTLIRDFISGFFILFEGLLNVGDYIKVGDNEGTVEQVGLRTTQFRAYNGVLHTIPNGELTKFGNYNRGFCRALVDVEIPYEQNIREVMVRIHEVATAWAAEHSDIVLEPPSLLGILTFGEAGMKVQVAVKVKPQTHWPAERELRVALKEAFDLAGIRIPGPRRDVDVIHSPGHNQKSDG